MNDRPLTRSGVGTVLVVDDEPIILRMVEKVLSSRGHFVTTATNADEAVSALQGGSIDILLSDLRMPGMSGVDLLATARREFPNVVRIAFSGANDLGLAMGCVNDGEVYRYLSKPCTASEILEAVDAALGVRERMLSPEPPPTTPIPLGGEAGARRSYVLTERRIRELRELVRVSEIDSLCVFITNTAGAGFDDPTVHIPNMSESGPRRE